MAAEPIPWSNRYKARLLWPGVAVRLDQNHPGVSGLFRLRPQEAIALIETLVAAADFDMWDYNAHTEMARRMAASVQAEAL